MSSHDNDQKHYAWHDQILVPTSESVIESLGDENGARLFQLHKTQKGYRFVECCDGYYGTTLSEDQFKKLIKEMTELLDAEPTTE